MFILNLFFSTTTWQKNSNSGNVNFKPKGKIEFEKKDKVESSKGKEKLDGSKEVREKSQYIKCWKCQGIGHIARDCPNKRTMIIKKVKLSPMEKKVRKMS